MTIVIWSLLLFGVFLNACAQLFLKFGVDRIGEFSFTLQNLIPIGWKLATNYFVILGLLCYVISVVVWLMVLSRIPVGIAYPMVSIGYIITAIAGYFLLGESLTVTRVIGILVIIIGVYLVARV
ncbi:SMR family transporter [Fangia hongkongensis]|uniref:SMR family transporter n=1 Tax=Fangia hongkongensis TaxID=270495 RepID=UPI00036966C5|nr:SMR family transporter [Fangia hongkongensis]MBK2126040.1 EamA family transporter [Fangia hongkongensis]